MSRYRVYCETESSFVTTGYLNSPPTECPNDSGHTINSDITVALDTVQTGERIIFSGALGRDYNRPYYQLNRNNNYEIVNFCYHGSDVVGGINSMHIILSKTNDATTARFRLVDLNNGSILSDTTWNAGSKNIDYCYEVTSFSNVPTDSTILSLQCQRTNSSGNIRLYSIIIK